jgi:hypothetical protein
MLEVNNIIRSKHLHDEIQTYEGKTNDLFINIKKLHQFIP